MSVREAKECVQLCADAGTNAPGNQQAGHQGTRFAHKGNCQRGWYHRFRSKALHRRTRVHRENNTDSKA